MNNEVHIENYAPQYAESHYEFATKMFGARRKRRNSDYLYWKFSGQEGKEIENLKLAVINDNVVGQLGLIPCRINIDGKVVDSQWACDLMVDPDYRGKGIAVQLYNAAHKQKVITLGSDPSPAAEISMIRAGYKKLQSSNKQFIPINLGLPLRMKGYPVKWLDRVKNPFLSKFMKKKYRGEFDKVNTIDTDQTEVFKLDKPGQVYIERDREFKNWRFESFKDYYPGIQLYKLRGTSTYFSGYYNGNIYFITDFILEKEIHFSTIVNYILRNTPKNIERVRFQNNIHGEVLGSSLTTIKNKTKTSIIYYTKDQEIDKLIKGKYFYYTHHDTDENI